MSNSLLISQGKEPGKRYAIDLPRVSIGRDRTNTVRVSDIEVSRSHCEIGLRDGRYLLTDLDSSNGTFVNDVRVDEYVLFDEDRIRIGSTVIVFEQEPDTAAAFDPIAESPTTIGAASLTGFPKSYVDDSRLDSQTFSRLEDESSFYESTNTSDGETSRRFVQVGNDLRFLYNASLATSRNDDCRAMLEEILNLVFNWVSSDRGCVYSRTNPDSDFEISFSKMRHDLDSVVGFDSCAPIFDYVKKEKVGVLSHAAAIDKRWGDVAKIAELKIGEVMCVPILGRSELLGWIYVDTIDQKLSPIRRFNEDQLKLLIALAHQAAVAIENNKYFNALIDKERLAAIGETTSVIAHHVKNQIQGINGGSHLIELGLKSKDLKAIDKGWQIVNRNQSQISRLVIDMLILGNPYLPNCETADLNQAITQAIEKLDFQSTQQNIACQFQQNPDVTPFEFEFAGIMSSVMHLITCGLLACQEIADQHGKISISVSQDEDSAKVVVEDNGELIEFDQRNPQGASFGLSSDQNMYGISLAVCRKIVEGHLGTVSVTHPDSNGNKFEIRIPRFPQSN